MGSSSLLGSKTSQIYWELFIRKMIVGFASFPVTRIVGYSMKGLTVLAGTV